uniref:Gla domain-containing protein n=1 Tax=Erpetoichthys calabaricus TaxID=27687 RepID=A0A8C4SFY1_ERPCA
MVFYFLSSSFFSLTLCWLCFILFYCTLLLYILCMFISISFNVNDLCVLLCFARLLNAYKRPFERQREICEDFGPCENYARFRGYNRAYQYFFGKPGQTTRNRY